MITYRRKLIILPESETAVVLVPVPVPVPEIKVVARELAQSEAAPITLGDVQSTLRAKLNSTNKLKFTGVISSINTMAKVIGCAAHDLPANPAKLKERLATTSPAMAGLTEGSWSSMRSRVLSGLRLTTVKVMAGRRTDPLAPAWHILMALLPKNDGTRPALSRFAGYCTDFKYEPDEINDSHFKRFLSILETESMRGEPRLIHRKAIMAWNWATEAIPEWPKQIIIVPTKKSDGYVLPLSSFSASFQSNVEDHLEYLRDPPEDDDDAPIHGLKETTLNARRFSLLQIASVLACEGIPIATFNSVSDLPTRAHMALVCQFYTKRFLGRENSTQVLTLLEVLRGLAHHQKKDDDLAKAIARRIKKLLGKAGQKRGMTKKNKDRLLPFKNHALVRDFLLLPLALCSRAAKKTPDKLKAAHTMRNAIAMEIELMCPLRSANLANLSVDKNLIAYNQGKQKRYRLYIPAEEVKNDQSISMDLPEQACDLIHRYIKDFRHLLIDSLFLATGPTYLFPTSEGKPMTGKNLAFSICKMLKSELGLEFNIHLFRHVACFLYLKQNPNGYETMRKTLGHKQLTTTINYYAELEQLEAFQNFDETILLLRAGAPHKHQKNVKKPVIPALVFPVEQPVKFDLSFQGVCDVI